MNELLEALDAERERNAKLVQANNELKQENALLKKMVQAETPVTHMMIAGQR